MGRTKVRGYTLIEALIVIAIIAILAATVLPFFQSKESRKKWQENRFNTLCINGYQFVSPRFSSDKIVQVVDANGHGVPCN